MAQADLPFETRVCDWSAASRFQTTRASRDRVPLLVHTGDLGKPPSSGEAKPDLSHTEESDPRARPAFGLGVESPGDTRICSLLARGIMSFRIS